MIEKIKNKYDTTVSEIRLDQEIARTDRFRIWANENGVTLEATVPYAHYQNGVAERKNRTIRDTTAALLEQGNLSHVIVRGLEARTQEILAHTRLPEKLWPWAIHHAIWARNRLPSRANRDCLTPWEMATGQPPDLSVEKTWGSRVYVTLPYETRGPKLQARAWAGHHVGFESEAIYLVYDPALNVVKRAPPSRIAEREALQDLQDGGPSFEERVPGWEIEVQGQVDTSQT